MLRALRQCLTGADDDDLQSHTHTTNSQSVSRYLYLDEKSVLSQQPGPNSPSKDEVADKLITTLCSAAHAGNPLQADLDNIVREAGWWDRSIAERMLAILQKIIEEGSALGAAMQAAFARVYKEASKIAELAKEFAKAHPIVTGVVCTVIALGILYVLWPWALEALGFTARGPLADSFAAAWQRLYGGRVPVGSLFSYLQRLGMTWNGSVVVLAPLTAKL